MAPGHDLEAMEKRKLSCCCQESKPVSLHILLLAVATLNELSCLILISFIYLDGTLHNKPITVAAGSKA
jgi:hypothetical protein